MATKKNSTQDVEIASLKQWKKDFQCMWERFISNDFHDLKKEVKEIKSWLFFGFLALIGTTILTQIILKFFQ